MPIPPLIRKQFLVAVYSSPAISALTVTPVFILSRFPFELYFWAFGMATLLVLLLWAANIGFYALVNKGTIAGRQTRLRYLLSYVFCILSTFFLFHSLAMHTRSHFGSPRNGIHFHVIVFFAVDTVILILQDLVVTRERNAAIELENSRLKIRNMEAMNLQLKQQVQPHFLFNSLSTLKSLISVSPEQAGEYLVRLSGFLRSSLSSHAFSVVKVGRELDLCIDYLEMQQIRFEEALQFAIDVPEAIRETFFVPVFSLQLLIENAIKHNVLTREQPLLIRLDYKDGAITVSNNLQKRPVVSESSGTGLVNLRERYKALGGGPLVIDEDAHRFSVSIKVFANEAYDSI